MLGAPRERVKIIRRLLDRVRLTQLRPLLGRYAQQLAEGLVIVLAGVGCAPTNPPRRVSRPRHDPQLQQRCPVWRLHRQDLLARRVLGVRHDVARRENLGAVHGVVVEDRHVLLDRSLRYPRPDDVVDRVHVCH